MFIAYLTLLSALSISGVAIFYSVIGLATIFPGAFWPVVIMGSVLEVGKLITASWLYRHWKQTRFLLKTYLTIAVVVLSLITSMGIFGFLSKAHLEQNLAEDTVTQRIEIINNKIESQKVYIKRQTMVIERAEKSLETTGKSNTEAISIEQNSLKQVEDKFKTLLKVETDAIKDLNARMSILDKNVTDVLNSNKSFFNEEKAAADLKASQKEERADINRKIADAQKRIDTLKNDYATDTTVIQSRIDKLRVGDTDDKSDVFAQIKEAEANILKAQNNIDDLVVEREPLESKMIKLEAEVGPVKYIAALAVDWGVAKEVDTSEAVRWVILIIICVFDPLAVLLLIAANQSLLHRFPVKPLPPEEVLDLEKPDHDLTFDPKWNDLMARSQRDKMEEATAQLKDWQDKLEAFNKKVPKPEDKPVEIIQDTQKKTEEKEIVVDNTTDGFDPAEVEGFEEFNSKYDEPEYRDPAEVIKEIKAEQDAEAKAKQLEEFKKREKEEQEALEEIARKAREEDEKTPSEEMQEQLEPIPEEPTISEKIEEVMEPERLRPDFTEVLEPEQPKPKTLKAGMLGQVLHDKGKVKEILEPKAPTKDPATLTDEERKGMLNKFHQEHGKFEDISEDEIKAERDEANRLQFLEDVGITEEEARNHPPLTESRKAFFQDHIDDIKRGDTTSENLPPELAKTIAVLMSDYPDPEVITKSDIAKSNIEQSTAEGLKEKFMIDPKTEDRDMTDDELDKLLDGWEDDQQTKADPTLPMKMVIKDGVRRMVPDTDYKQNEEQTDETMWQKVKDLPEPEKNDLDLPPIKTTDDAVDLSDSVDVKVEEKIPYQKFTNYKNKISSDEDYRQRIEARINDLITKLENGEIKLNDLTPEDKHVIMDILNQNG